MKSELPKWLRGRTTYFDTRAWATIVRRAGGPGSGKRMKPVWIRRRQESRKRGEREKQMETVNAKLDVSRQRWFQLQADRRERGWLQWHLLAAMEPGAWYAMKDISTLAGAPYNSVKAKLNDRMIGNGLVEKTDNPAWRDKRNEFGFKVWDEPRYLWRLTEEGIAARAVARGELEARGWPSYLPDEKEPPAGCAGGQVSDGIPEPGA
jgi:hypothetical protein